MRERTVYPPPRYLEWYGLFCTDSDTQVTVVSRVDYNHPYYLPTPTSASRPPVTWEEIYRTYVAEDPNYVAVNARRERRVAATREEEQLRNELAYLRPLTEQAFTSFTFAYTVIVEEVRIGSGRLNRVLARA